MVLMDDNNCDWQVYLKFECGMISMSLKCQVSLMARAIFKIRRLVDIAS